jgi:hypothetical protein
MPALRVEAGQTHCARRSMCARTCGVTCPLAERKQSGHATCHGAAACTQASSSAPRAEVERTHDVRKWSGRTTGTMVRKHVSAPRAEDERKQVKASAAACAEAHTRSPRRFIHSSAPIWRQDQRPRRLGRLVRRQSEQQNDASGGGRGGGGKEGGRAATGTPGRCAGDVCAAGWPRRVGPATGVRSG